MPVSACSQPAPQRVQARRTVLVIDDDATTRTVICRVADRAGLAAIGAATVEDAELLLGSHAFDLITLDIMLGPRGAHDMLDALVRLGFDRPVLIVSGMDEASVRAVAETGTSRDLDLLAPLTKPIDLAALRARFEAAVPL